MTREAGVGDTGGPAACQRLCWQTGLAGCLLLPRSEQHLEPFGPGSGCTSMAEQSLGCQLSPKQDRFSVVRPYREVLEGLRGNKWSLWAGWGQADVRAGAQVPHHLYWVWLCHSTRTPLRLKCSPPQPCYRPKPKAAALEKVRMQSRSSPSASPILQGISEESPDPSAPPASCQHPSPSGTSREAQGGAELALVTLHETRNQKQ